VFPPVCLTVALRKMNYGLYVVFVTPTCVLVADFAKPADEMMNSLTRLGNNLLGCLIAFLAIHLLWPCQNQQI
jgi:uncharacterized membrane protein YccC